jgi:hypothetical protein
LAGKNVEWIGAPVRACTAVSSSRVAQALRGGGAPGVGPRDHLGERTPRRVEGEEAVPEHRRAHRGGRARSLGEASVDGRSRGGDQRFRIELGAALRRRDGLPGRSPVAPGRDGRRIVADGPHRARSHIQGKDPHGCGIFSSTPRDPGGMFSAIRSPGPGGD